MGKGKPALCSPERQDPLGQGVCLEKLQKAWQSTGRTNLSDKAVRPIASRMITPNEWIEFNGFISFLFTGYSSIRKA